MADTFLATLAPMMVLFICILIGFILKKKNILPDNSALVLSKLENWVFVPSLILKTFSKYCTVSSVSTELSMILYSSVVMIIALIISIPLSGIFTKEEYSGNVYKYALSFANFSFMGNAIVPIILGEAALFGYMLFTLPLNIAVYTWGLFILIPSSSEKKGTVKNLINPIFISIVIGMFLGLSEIGLKLPNFVNDTISGFASCMAPVAMLLTGFVIGGYSVPELLKNKSVYAATFLRLIVLPVLFIAGLYFAGANKSVLSLALFAFGTPLGLNTIVFPAAYGGNTRIGASMAMISHTLCVITIPFLYSLLNLIF